MKNELSLLEKEENARITAEGFYDVEGAAKFLGISRASLFKLMNEGKVRYAKMGKSRRIPIVQIREYAESCIVYPNKDNP